MLVAWARQNGHFVLYVPSAYKLLYDSVFTCRDGLLDTPDTAKQLLKSMHDAHEEQLQVRFVFCVGPRVLGHVFLATCFVPHMVLCKSHDMQELADDEGQEQDVRTDARRLLELMQEGLASQESEPPVDAFLEVLDILRRFQGVRRHQLPCCNSIVVVAHPQWTMCNGPCAMDHVQLDDTI